MKLGVFDGMPAEEYFAIEAASNSGLGRLKQSPLHFWAENLDPEREPREPTPDQRLGTAIHTAIYEPARFDAQYKLAARPDQFPDYLATLDDMKTACRSNGLPVSGSKADLKRRLLENKVPVKFFDEIEAGQAGFELLKDREMTACRKIAWQLRESSAGDALFKSGHCERVCLWEDPETHVLCKARLDWVLDDGSTIVDAKSTRDASPKAFARSILDYGYHRQAAWYLDAVEGVRGDRPSLFVFAAFEKEPPYASALYYATPEMIEAGRRENRALLNRYADCMRLQYWPGYSKEIQPIALPHYYNAEEAL